MARCCNTTSKLSIISINLLTWLLAAGFIFLSIWMLREFGFYSDFLDTNHLSVLPACILLAIGLLLFLLGLVGCIGAVKEHKCIIGLYFSLLLVLLIGLGAGAGFAYMFRQKIDGGLHRMMMEGFKNYSDNSTVNKLIDDMQENMHCCGVDNNTDWLNLPWHQTHMNESYPASCCPNMNCSTNTISAYQKGCYHEIKEEFTGHIIAVYSVIGACALVLLIGMACSCMLLRDRRNRDFIYRDLGSDDGLHV